MVYGRIVGDGYIDYEYIPLSIKNSIIRESLIACIQKNAMKSAQNFIKSKSHGVLRNCVRDTEELIKGFNSSKKAFRLARSKLTELVKSLFRSFMLNRGKPFSQIDIIYLTPSMHCPFGS
jgi:hypothetical protein